MAASLRLTSCVSKGSPTLKAETIKELDLEDSNFRMNGGLQWVTEPLEALRWHLLDFPFHFQLQKVNVG